MRPVLAAPKDEAGRSARRRKVTPWREWYGTARWKKLRWQVLKEAAFICAMCGKCDADTANLVADHRTPHRGNPELFWKRDNLDCLCKPCHDGAKQAEERRMGFTL